MRVRDGRLVLVAAALASLAVAGQPADRSVRGFFDLPVAGGIDTLESLRIPPADRAFTLSFLARALYGQGSNAETANNARLALAAARAGAGSESGAETTVPAPFSEEVWRDLLQLPRGGNLFSTLADNRNALLLAAGATAADESIRALLDDDRGLREWIVREGAGPFGLIGRSLRLEQKAIAVPGGAEYAAIWEALAGVPPAKPPAFLRALLGRDGGRLAWYFDTLASLDTARLAWALGPGTPAERLAAAREMYATFRDVDPSWRLDQHPFQRNAADPQTVLQTVEVDGRRIKGPPTRAFWELLFSREAIRASDARSLSIAAGPDVSAAWLVHHVIDAPARERRARFEMLRLAQRMFPSPAAGELPDLVAALSGYRRFPAVLLTLERAEVRSAAVWAATIEAARRADQGAGRERRTTIAAFQAALALVERARLVHSLDDTSTERVLGALARAVIRERPVPASVAAWLVDTFVPALPPLEIPDAWTAATAYESTILQAMSGLVGRNSTKVEWEGLAHTVDIAATERDRVQRLRALVPSPGLDAALASNRPDDLVAALMALAYTPALGDPEGAILLSPDLVERHDFGESSLSNERRGVGPWRPPRDMLGVDGPWRVQGSILGLDIALARLALRRVADQTMPRAPTINLNDWDMLVRSVTTLDPFALEDGERDELAAAIARGRARVSAALSDGAAIEGLVREARLSAPVRELLRWMIEHEPSGIADLFSLRDLMWLGGPRLDRPQLDRWGVPAESLDGRLIPAMPASGPWDDHAGRADEGRMATQMPDLSLRLVEETARLRLPARLIPALLSFAVQDFSHDVDARFADDWPAMVRAARELPSSRIEDYVAALTGTGHLR